ncbi:MAG: alpha/beta fold hydrolase [Alphaproteobacteria bacterium]|nr:MAG: alpha/beta fold hydrolase [Alphaproteobacteria bacterium]
MYIRYLTFALGLTAFVLAGCSDKPQKEEAAEVSAESAPVAATAEDATPTAESNADPVAAERAAGRMIEIDTPKGKFNVWTRKVGDNPSIKVLLLHGGPGATHEYLKNVDNFFPGADIEYYYYDQLGSYFSDQPDDPSLWVIDRFVDEVEQVRLALGLGPDNFYLFGQSWGGALAMEYALKHQENLKGLIISNMMASGPAYDAYAEEVLMPQMDPDALAEIKALEAAEDYGNPRYEALLMTHHYVHHVLRLPPEEWPLDVIHGFEHINPDIYIPMQGPSELGISGVLGSWDISEEIHKITVPTLVIGATHDTMDPKYMEWMAEEIPNARFLLCPDGSHIALVDDADVYFAGLIQFIEDVDRGTFPGEE